MPETNKPREMTLPAIRKRFDYGSWDHADCTWLYTKADQHAELLEACEAAHMEIGGLSAYLETCSPEVIVGNLPSLIASLNRKRELIEAAIRKARGE